MSKAEESVELLEHSPLGASSATRWIACPGSVRLCKDVPNTASEYAEEGTRAHELAEKILRGEKVEAESDEMLDAVMVYVDYIKEQFPLSDKKGPLPKLLIEEKFHLSTFHPQLYGTADCVMYFPEKKLLHVVDYKHGAGVSVEVENNKQLMYYALGALLKTGLPCTEVMITVAQPRCYHQDGPIRSWTTNPVDLMDFGVDLKRAAEKTEKPDAPLNSGAHCRWCPAKASCPALAKQASELAKNEFGKGLSYDPVKLSETLDQLDSVEAYIKGVREFAYAEASKGNEIPGWKLVPKRASRSWADELEAKRVARSSPELNVDELFEMKFKSVSQVQKTIGAEKFRRIMEPLVVSISSGNNLVRESDKRAPVKEVAANVFNDHLNTQKLLD